MVPALLLALALLGLASAQQPGVVRGRVILPATVPHPATTLMLHTSTGAELRTYTDNDGSFEFHDVPPGAHQLQVFHPNLLFPEFRMDVSRKQLLTRVSLSHNRQVAIQHSPLVIRPGAEAHYYEKRKPFDVWSFVKSPYGLMIMFSLFAIVVFPRLKMDPEDYKEFQQQLGTTPAPAQVTGGSTAAQQARLRDR